MLQLRRSGGRASAITAYYQCNPKGLTEGKEKIHLSSRASRDPRETSTLQCVTLLDSRLLGNDST